MRALPQSSAVIHGMHSRGWAYSWIVSPTRYVSIPVPIQALAEGGGKAYCVSTENFVDIATRQFTALGYDLPNSGPASKAASAEALMVPRGIDGPPRKARKLDLVAYGRHAYASILRELHDGRAHVGIALA